MKVEIGRVAIPQNLASDEAADFIAAADVANASQLETWGADDFVYPPESVLPQFAPSAFRSRFLYLARLDGLPVGRVSVAFPLDEDATSAELSVDVVPVARGRGIGTALLKHGEEFVETGGRVDVSAFTEHPWPAGGRGDAADGASGTPELPEDHESRFMRRNGYRLGQLELMAELRLPVEEEDALRRRVLARAEGYRLVQWWRHVPESLAAQYGRLRSQMTRDVPHDGIVLEQERWDAPRVREHENRMIDRGQPTLVTAALHEESGELVAYTEIVVAQGSPVVEQHDTLVAPGHRGRGLGLWIKLANLRRLAEVSPRAGRVLSWTGVGNAPMRHVNARLGFRPIAVVGDWQKRLDG